MNDSTAQLMLNELRKIRQAQEEQSQHLGRVATALSRLAAKHG
jgi:hypothetical protein